MTELRPPDWTGTAENPTWIHFAHTLDDRYRRTGEPKTNKRYSYCSCCTSVAVVASREGARGARRSGSTAAAAALRRTPMSHVPPGVAAMLAEVE